MVPVAPPPPPPRPHRPGPSFAPARPETSGLGVAGMVLGILSLCGGITALPAVICSHLSLRAIRRSGGGLGGRGMAITGLVIGYLALAGWVATGLLIRSGAKAAEQRKQLAGAPFEMSGVPVPAFPPLPALEPLDDEGVEVGQLRLNAGNGPGESMELRIYRPQGTHAAASLPCVLLAPAGTNLLSGSEIGALDEEAYHFEALPYAKAGMMVVMYSLDGNIAAGDEEDPDKLRAAYQSFRAARAGLVNGRNALEFARARLPEVDPAKIFAAGHSSAGTLSLLLGEHELRLAGCIAYAPAADLESRFADLIANPFASISYPGLRDFSKRSSPKTHAGQLAIPVFLFHAAGDDTVPVADSRDFSATLKARGADATYLEVSGGDHYESMMADGIPAGIRWIKQRK